MNKRLLELMLDAVRSLGAETEIADVHSMKLPIFDHYIPLDEQPKQLFWLIEQMKQADGFIICSPTYLGSLSGAVKNTLDSLHLAHGEPRAYFDGRPVALGSYGFHGQENAINSLAFVTRVMGATVVPESVIVSGIESDPDPEIFSSASVQRNMMHSAEQLLVRARAFRDHSSG